MLDLLDLHRKLYEARWKVQGSKIKDLEEEFLSKANEEGIDIENMMEQLYIPPYKDDLLPNHLKESIFSKSVGRPSMGTTKKVSITLPDDIWNEINSEINLRDDLKSTSAYFREMVLDYLLKKDRNKEDE